MQHPTRCAITRHASCCHDKMTLTERHLSSYNDFSLLWRHVNDVLRRYGFASDCRLVQTEDGCLLCISKTSIPLLVRICLEEALRHLGTPEDVISGDAIGPSTNNKNIPAIGLHTNGFGPPHGSRKLISYIFFIHGLEASIANGQGADFSFSNYGITTEMGYDDCLLMNQVREEEKIPAQSLSSKLSQSSLCLGTTVSWDLRETVDVKARIGAANELFGLAKSTFWGDAEIPLGLRMRFYKAIVVNVLLWGCESWALCSADAKALQVFQFRCLRSILKINVMHKVSRERTLEMCQVPDILKTLDL